VWAAALLKHHLDLLNLMSHTRPHEKHCTETSVVQDAASIVIVGAGPAGRAAAEILPDARVIARPAATAWHAEQGMLWIETGGRVQSVPFSRLLLCADEKLLLVSLGCAFRDGLPIVDAQGQTTRPGVFAAGRILGAASPEAAAGQGRIAARALAGLAAEGSIAPSPLASPLAPAPRRDPVAMAAPLDAPRGPERDRALLAQVAWIGPVRPARPVSFAALAGAAQPVSERLAQQDVGVLA